MRAAPTECCIEVFPPRLPAQKQSRNPFSENKTIENHFKFKFSLCPAKTFILMRAAPDGVLIKFLIRGVSGDLRGGLRMIFNFTGQYTILLDSTSSPQWIFMAHPGEVRICLKNGSLINVTRPYRQRDVFNDNPSQSNNTSSTIFQHPHHHRPHLQQQPRQRQQDQQL